MVTSSHWSEFTQPRTLLTPPERVRVRVRVRISRGESRAARVDGEGGRVWIAG